MNKNGIGMSSDRIFPLVHWCVTHGRVWYSTKDCWILGDCLFDQGGVHSAPFGVCSKNGGAPTVPRSVYSEHRRTMNMQLILSGRKCLGRTGPRDMKRK